MQQPSAQNALRMAVLESFEDLVLELVIVAYRKMYEEGYYSTKWKETKFSAVLKGYMKQQCHDFFRQTHQRWYVTREYYKDNELVLSGENDPDAVPRIDIIVVTWQKDEEVVFPFECKQLSEKSLTSIKHYIERGLVDRYLTSKDYSAGKPWGGMIGYVLRGKHDTIVSKLNEQINCQLRGPAEHLQMRSAIANFEAIYTSKHQHPSQIGLLTVTHLFLPFQAIQASTKKISNKKDVSPTG